MKDIERVVEKHLSRQRNTHIGGKELKRERWDRELTDDLFKAGLGDRATCEVRASLVNDETDKMLAQQDPDLAAVFGDERASAIAREVT